MAKLPLFRGFRIPLLCKQLRIFRPALADDCHTQMKLHLTWVLQRSFASPTDKNDLRSEDIVHIDCQELRERMRTKNIMLIDVREPIELEESGRIDGAINIPLADVEQAFQMEPSDFQKKYGVTKPDKSDNNIVFSCQSGKRSLHALQIANRLGYKLIIFDDVEQPFQIKHANFQKKHGVVTPNWCDNGIVFSCRSGKHSPYALRIDNCWDNSLVFNRTTLRI
ncbi:Thiosulfate sulfurtransferase/rhodanese-like domain-containing protein 3 [Clonorchis sinensis]|uniref:Thiosulfate sulfurtransferase/rhodanese-like domain-containing protein 3 n=1 Tax=Clonorchis sinensis TaxID=79923 RepID=A0A3R7C1F8_CLOSI|nr:Thiosulfate sulfurtransferase/rhodanese-like domain-containing protein 3 [Clonorchis sinensis]